MGGLSAARWAPQCSHRVRVSGQPRQRWRPPFSATGQPASRAAGGERERGALTSPGREVALSSPSLGGGVSACDC